MLKDEFNRLMTLFQEASEGKSVNLEEVFGQSLALFEQMKQSLITGSQEEKIEAMKLMSQMYQQMMEASQRICESSGMTEEQLMAYAENPANFTPEQWRTIQESKEKISHSGEELVKLMQGKKPEEPKRIPPPGPMGPKGGPTQWMRP